MYSTLDGLIPNCFAYWSVVNETGYQYFDVTLIVRSRLFFELILKCCVKKRILCVVSMKQPNGLGNISIADIEGNFLSELVDFVNSTVSRDISLIVPRKGAFPDWVGLKPNAKYVNL